MNVTKAKTGWPSEWLRESFGPTPANCLETRAKVRGNVIMIHQQIREKKNKAGGT